MKLRCFLSLLLILSVKGYPRHRRDENKACENKYEQCAEWKKANMCEQENNKDYMASICPVDCGYCKSSVSETPTQSEPAPVAAPAPAPAAAPAPAPEPAPAPAQPAPYQGVPEDSNKATESASKTSKDTKSSEASSDDLQAVSKSEDTSDDSPATNEQTHSSSKHLGKETGKHEKFQGSGSSITKEDKAPVAQDAEESSKESAESGSGGAGYFEDDDDDEIDDLVNLSDEDDDGNDADDAEEGLESRQKSESENSENAFPTEEQEEQTGFGEPQKGLARANIESPEESGESGGEEQSGNERADIAKDAKHAKEQHTAKAAEKNVKLDKSDKKKSVKKDESKKEKNIAEEKKSAKRSKKKEESSHKKTVSSQKQKTVEKSKVTVENKHERKNLLENMIEKGQLKALSVTKPTREKVPHGVKKEKTEKAEKEEKSEKSEKAEKAEEEEELDLTGTALEFLSGSGSGDDVDKLHLTLRQSFDTKYANKKTPAYQILSGNLQKDVEKALGEGNEVSDISFSESEIEGNPRTMGKVRVNFRFLGNWNKLEKLVKTGSINGLLVVKDSLEGPGILE